MRPRSYEILARAVEEGAIYGVNRAFKHTDNPSKEDITGHVVNNVMNSICEVFEFPAGYDVESGHEHRSG